MPRFDEAENSEAENEDEDEVNIGSPRNTQ